MTEAANDKRQAIKRLADLPQWLTWKAGPKDAAGKFPKYPQNIHTGGPATGSHDAGTYLENCGTIDQAQEVKKKHNHSGLGFVVTKNDPVCAIDIDDCLDNGSITPEAKAVVERFDSYTEISPSGKGLRIFCLGKLPSGALSNPSGTPFEIYDCNKFLTVTGNIYGELREARSAQEAVDWFCKNVTGFRGDGGTDTEHNKAESVLNGVPEGQRDKVLYRYACRLRAKNMSREEAETLVLTAARACAPPFPEREAVRKIDQAWRHKPGEAEVKPEEKPKASVVRACELTPEPIEWIWPGWFAAGKVHTFAGAAGIGKTRLAVALVSTMTVGGRFPDGTRAGGPWDVAIWSGEDDPADTLLPRLIADGADQTRVHIIRGVEEGGEYRSFDPSTDIPTLEPILAQHHIRALIVDPVVSAVAGDSHKNAEVRRALQPLVDLAERFKCAVIGITHFSKGTRSRDPLERVTGSIAFGALARMVWAAIRLPDDDENKGARLFARVKSNIGPDGGGFKYYLEQTALPDHPGINTTRLLWGEAIEGTAKALFDMAETNDENKTATDEASVWLRETLAAGPMPAKEIYSQGRGVGFSQRVVRRAKEKLQIRSAKSSFTKGWEWALFEEAPKAPQQLAGAPSERKNIQYIDNINTLRRRPQGAPAPSKAPKRPPW